MFFLTIHEKAQTAVLLRRPFAGNKKQQPEKSSAATRTHRLRFRSALCPCHQAIEGPPRRGGGDQ
jgi:hypothetical protein